MTGTGKELTVLDLDDDVADAELLRFELREITPFDIHFIHSTSPAEARAVLAERKIDLAFVDYRLGGQSGLDFLTELRASGDLRPLILLTGQGDEQIAASALHAGADEYISKARLSPDDLYRAISTSLTRSQNRLVEIKNKQLLDELKSKNELLEANAQRLADLYETAHQFVNDVSHEFRTPLTVIKEFSSIIRDGLAGPTSKEQLEYLGIVLDRVDDLGTMIEDMLDMSRLEAGHLGLRRKQCTMESIIARLRTTLDQKASLRNIRMKYDLPPDLVPVYCDPEKIARVIINLGVNAVKFSAEDSEIQISARYLPEKALVLMSVKDSGPGIRPESLKLLFERFAHVGTTDKSAIKGFGLGLNICKELVHLNFGDIGVDSEVGKGSTFWFTVPTADPARLIRHYLQRVKSFRADVDFASLVAARIPPDAGDAARDAAEEFLHQHIRRSDLVLRTQPNQWLVVFCSHGDDVDAILTRNQEAWQEARLRNPQAPTTLTLEKYGTWKLSNQSDEFLTRFEDACKLPKECHA